MSDSLLIKLKQDIWNGRSFEGHLSDEVVDALKQECSAASMQLGKLGGLIRSIELKPFSMVVDGHQMQGFEIVISLANPLQYHKMARPNDAEIKKTVYVEDIHHPVEDALTKEIKAIVSAEAESFHTALAEWLAAWRVILLQ